NRQANLDGLELADDAIANEFTRTMELRRRTLLRTDLQHALLRVHDVTDEAALGDGHTERLLNVDVLARQSGFDNRLRVPVIRRADHHRVNVFAREDFAVIAVSLHGDFLRKRFLVRLFDLLSGEFYTL